jgi:diguanylate cyclase (GGDEF)-like protein/putative nucleotidyltransferase with HDIG domain
MQFFSYITLIPFISLLCYCILLEIIIKSRKNKIARYYTFYIIAMIVWSLGSFFMRTELPPGMLFWNKVLCSGLISMPVIFYHFTLVLTETHNQNKKLIFAYVSGFIFLICNFAGKITEDAYYENNTFNYKLGPIASIMAVWSVCYLILAFINILDNVRSNRIPFVKVKFILFGVVLIIIGGLFNLAPSLGRYPFDILSNTINAFFIAYSIYKYRFLQIKIIVKKGLAYSAYTIILTGVYIITIVSLQQILSSLMGFTTITSTLLIAVLLSLVFQPIKNVLQHWIDRLLYKEQLDHQRLLRDFSITINNVLDLDELTELLINTIDRVCKPEKISLVLRKDREGFSLYNPKSQYRWENEMKFDNKHPIVNWFAQGKPTLSMEEIEGLPMFSGLWSVEKRQLYDLMVELIIPIKLRDELIGFTILSEKKTGGAYTSEEFDLIFTLVNNAAIVIENAKMYDQAKQQAITDGLTKLYNHRYFQEVLSKLIYNEKYEKFSVAMIDVDLFKLYNDLYGHSAGDRALSKIAEVLQQATKKEDIVARYGGEEFAVIFPNIEGEEALSAIERIRRFVENAFSLSRGIEEFLTISAGVASYPFHGKNPEAIIDCADTAMYLAKRNGRNQCRLYSKDKGECENKRHDHEMENMQDSIKTAYFSAIYALAATIDAKDHYTYGHSENVSRYAVELAKAAGFDEDKVDCIRNAGLLHDIGKIGVAESILTKAQSLTKEEYEVMKRHVDISISIIKHVPGLIKVIPAIMSHHERYDGKGYPRGVKGENIPIEGRCLCIVDAFDAMTTDRPYRKALSLDQAVSELKRNIGIQFDPQLTEIFIRLIQDGKITVNK